MESSSSATPSEQNLSNTAGSKRKRDSDPPDSGAESSKDFRDGSIANPAETVSQKVKGNETIKSISSEKRDSGPRVSRASKLKKFRRDPRICRTDLSRVDPPPVSKPGGQNVKDNEPVRAVGPSVKTEYCEDYFSDGGCKNEMCQFAHGDWEVNEPLYIPPKDAIVFHPICCGKIKGGSGVFGPPPFTAVVYPYIDESHIGIVFGNRGELFQWICNMTGVKLTVEYNVKDPGFKKIVISGAMHRCFDASALVDALFSYFVSFSEREKIPPVPDYKTQLCMDYAKGGCKYDAETCCFAHGDAELRTSSVQILQGALKARRSGKEYNPSDRV